MSPLETAIARRLTELKRTARMWGSPEELECVAIHFTHVLLRTRSPEWSFEKTFEHWKSLGGPFADDAEEHANMRAKLWGEQELKARTQVVEGFLVVWTGLDRHRDRVQATGLRPAPWQSDIDRLLRQARIELCLLQRCFACPQRLFDRLFDFIKLLAALGPLRTGELTQRFHRRSDRTVFAKIARFAVG